MPVRFLSAALLCVAPLAAQSTLHVVDVNGGPGSSFRQIHEAVAAAAPGDRIVVRAGNYSSFRISGKPLTIVGEPGAGLGGFIGIAFQISGIPAGTTCAVSGLAVNTGIPYTTVGVAVSGCEGRVLLDSIDTVLGSVVQVDRSPRVAMVRVGTGSGRLALRAVDSAVNATSCRFQGVSGVTGGSGIGAELIRSVVSFAGCTITGTDQFFVSQPRPGMSLDNAYVTVTDDGTHVIAAGQTTMPITAVVGSGNLAMDRRVVVRSSGGAPLTDPGIVVGTQDYPLLEAGRPQVGGVANAQLAGTAGGNYALALGLPADWRLVPGLYGARWLDPATSIVVSIGTLDVRGVASLRLQVPAGTALVGVPLIWQGVADQGTGTSPAYSNPVALIARP